MVRRAFSATSRSGKKLDFFEYLQYFNYVLNLDFRAVGTLLSINHVSGGVRPHCEDLTFFEL